ncbi:pyruvate kinase [Cocleimonas sp. KMM 6892]|uniref:pyruvate kinase n=1 Tax=unclassified Cocleimonas TaxID=2639732 RepID=UPI002DB784F3|nr:MULTISPECIES: pyruvate kinase [unclassified Cocleimonas]MEB8431337.1 pyruvate kinase [Cocleimonas sp. KMM 6892]MEC4713891.1 pyruvate kinase [Cocleimonas sp. KMM 6895]MEC4743222.1 pyruvate kinase [Cocleimonas sp. KMM 6896]
MRRTKIVATMGPATDTPESVEAMIRAGVDVVRMNFSHGEVEDHIRRVKMVRDIADKLGWSVGILGDLQGPKIRIDRFVNDKVTIIAGDSFILDAALDKSSGTTQRVGIAYKDLPNDVYKGDELLLDDGRIVLAVTDVIGEEIHTKVLVGGDLSNNKGINKRGGGISAEALTEKDKEDIKTAAKIGVDFLAVSFPRSAADIEYARLLMQDAGGDAALVAKIERAEAVEQPTLDDIISASDVIMVARGDLGVEIGDANLPLMQKKLIKRARNLNCAVITATQMMETMIDNTIPTRAEVFDVANAVMDGTDAVMLSGETAVGKHPAKVVSAMANICIEAEQSTSQKKSRHRIGKRFQRIDEAIAMSTMYAANHMGVKGIGALTESGSTALWMSRISSGIPIYAMTTHKKTCRKVSMYRGVYPVWVHEPLSDPLQANRIVVEHLVVEKIVKDGDLVIVTKGDLLGTGSDGGTNQMKVIRVGEHHNG